MLARERMRHVARGTMRNRVIGCRLRWLMGLRVVGRRVNRLALDQPFLWQGRRVWVEMLRWWRLDGRIKCALLVQGMRLVGMSIKRRLVSCYLRLRRRRSVGGRGRLVIDVWSTQDARMKPMARRHRRRRLWLVRAVIENKGRTRLSGIRAHCGRSLGPVALVRRGIVNLELELWIVFVCNQWLGGITPSWAAAK